jgi:hypothetical protein
MFCGASSIAKERTRPKVGAHDLVEAIFSLPHVGPPDARVGDQHVQRAELRRSGGEGIFHCGAIANVGRDTHGLRRQFGGHTLERRSAATE